MLRPGNPVVSFARPPRASARTSINLDDILHPPRALDRARVRVHYHRQGLL